jgi:hypothetical protein
MVPVLCQFQWKGHFNNTASTVCVFIGQLALMTCNGFYVMAKGNISKVARGKVIANVIELLSGRMSSEN